MVVNSMDAERFFALLVPCSCLMSLLELAFKSEFRYRDSPLPAGNQKKKMQKYARVWTDQV
jgi:hypothetical protein